MLTRREVILAKVEQTYGVDAVPTAATDAVLVENPAWSHEGARMVDRSPAVGRLAHRQALFGGTLKQITFEAEIKGSGTAGTAPELGVLLRGCGFSQTVSAGVSVTYKPASTNHESLTIYYYSDGLLYKITGARGTVTGNLEAGQTGKLSFTFTGKTSAPTDVALVSPTLAATVPPRLVSVPFTIDSYAAVISSLEFDAGITVSMPPSIAAADGYAQLRITERNLTGSFDPEAILVATQDFIGKWRSGALMALDTGVIGGTAGNRYQVQMPAVYYNDVGQGERDGIRTFEMSFAGTESAGDDEISLIFT
jgi:hypothetical protein